MKRKLGKIALAAVGGAAALSLAWRFASSRRSVPCPPWLGWMLENRFTEGIAGSQILDRAGIEPGMKVLDVGCGVGRLTIPAARRVGPTGQVFALDIQPEMLERTQKKARAANLTNIRPVQGGAGEGKLPEAYFDRALLVLVLGEIVGRQAALAEIATALKPGGVLSVTEVLPDPHFQSRSTVRRLALAAGFREQRTLGTWRAYTMNLVKPAPEAVV